MRFHLIRKNLGRKKVRTLFTGLSILIAFLLYGLLTALSKSFSIGLDLAGADRLVTIHKVSLTVPLPISYQNRIANIEGVKTISHYTWFGGYHQDPRNQIQSTPTDVDSFRQVYPEYTMPEEQWDAWKRTRTGMVMGEKLAEKLGFSIGDRVPIGSTIWPQQDGNRSWELDLVGLFRDPSPSRAGEQALYFNYEYFNEARQFGRDTVGRYTLLIDEADQSERIAREVDRMFANSPAETKTTTEKGFVQGFANQFGNIGAIVRYVLLAVFFTMMLVAGNTMAQSVRERTSEIAVMKTLGFSDRSVLGLILSEGVLLSTVAGCLGLLLALVLTTGLREAMARFLPGLIMTPGALLLGVALAVGLGIVAGVLPAIRAQRLDVVKALARR
ncbi:MAG: FtsX-like permease family protein [Pseudomonadota bacterium]